MKAKCFAIISQNQQPIAEYANPSQKSFLDYQLKQQVSKMRNSKKSTSIQYDKTSNGVWYRKFYSQPQAGTKGYLLLLAPQSANVSLATSMFSKTNQIAFKGLTVEKLKMKLAQIIRMCNANTQFQKINTNVAELQGIMKNNISRIADNISDLGNVQRKSEMMSSLSMQLQKDSRELQKKMKRKKLIFRLVVGGLILLAIFLLIYMIFF